MRIAIFSDIHGNSIALDAVLQDIRARGGVDADWVIGDLAAFGHDPLGCLERIYALPNVVVTRGNTDRFLLNDAWTVPAQLPRDDASLNRYLETTSSLAWTMGALASTDWTEKIAALPLEYRTKLPDGTRVLCVHASPGTDDGMGVNPATTQEELNSLFENCDADLVFVGHTHEALERSVDTIRIFNPGCVSNPPPPDLRAKYILLDADAHGYRITRHFVEYDRAAVIAILEKQKHPGAHFISQHMRGERKPPWQQK
jgi:putative phosphoesterase